jgi:ribosomal protein S27AE
MAVGSCLCWGRRGTAEWPSACIGADGISEYRVRTRSLELALRGIGAAPSVAQVDIEVLNPADRLKRAGLAFAAGLAVAILGVPIPIVHFVLVPGALLVGLGVALYRLRQGETFQRAKGRCPYCGSEQTFTLFGGFQLPKRLDCGACHRDLYLAEL